MTKGNPGKVLIMFSLPMLLSMAFQQLYNIADSIIAGQFVGTNALAAVGASYPVTMLFLAFAMGASIGSSVIISQLFGTKQIALMKSAISTAIIAIMSLSVLLTAVGFFACKPLLTLLKTDTEIFAASSQYLFIYIGGLAFLFLYNAATSIFTGLGDSRTPLYFLIFSSLFNIGLDILFVTVFNMGVAGVAWATFIAQGLSGVAAMFALLLRLRKIKTDEPYKKFNTNLFKKIMVVAVPSIMQQSFISVGQLMVQGLVNSFGVDTTAGYSAAIKVNTFCVAIFNTMSSALSSYTAQNAGAGKYDRVKKGYPTALIMVATVAAIFMVLLMLCSAFFVKLFVNSDDGQTVIQIGSQFMFIVALGYPIVAFKVITDGLLRGAGYMVAFMSSTFSDLIIRVALSYILAPFIGFNAIAVSFLIGWGVGAVVTLGFYLSGKWKNTVKV